MQRFIQLRKVLIPGLMVWAIAVSGCARLQVPQIDPVGNCLFLPPGASTTSVMTPFQEQQPPAVMPAAINRGPAFTQPPRPPVCANGKCGAALGRPRLQPSGALVSHKHPPRRRHAGALTTTPSRIVAPVGAEVIVLAGICGKDGHYVTNQPLEWMLSQDSAGQIIQVGGMNHSLFNQLLPPSSRKLDGDYAWGRTGLKEQVIDRGTDTPVDDIKVDKGQTWITLSSASEGTSYLTCVAPKNDFWPERKSITRVHWVDGIWSIPLPTSAAAGSVAPLSVSVTRPSDGTGVPGWLVRYQIVGGVPAEFVPAAAQTAEVTTNSRGQAPVQIRQPAGQAVSGPTQVRIEIVRPSRGGDQEVVLESGITTVNWSSPALTIRAIGPRTAGINQPFNYRIEISNPGDQVARGVVVSSDNLTGDVEYISSNPKPSQYGNRYQWELGDIAPGNQVVAIDVQLRSGARGTRQLCFEVASQSDQLRTEACGETEIAVPCIGLKINGPENGGVGDSLKFNFDITNQCDEPLENVTVRLSHDAGLTAVGVPNPVELPPIERLAPGQVYNLPELVLQAIQGGTRCFTMEVRSSRGDTARARRCIEIANVVDPKVQVDMESQRVVSIGQQVLVRTRVANVGNIPLDNVTVLNSFSRSLNPVQRSPLPQRWIGDDLAFDIGRLDPGTQQVIEVLFDTSGVDPDAFSRVTVTNPLGVSEQTGVSIQINPAQGAGFPGAAGVEPPVGIPADPAGGLRVSVQALDRTVAVNNNARFRISIVNDRAVSDQNIAIRMLIPPGTRLQPLDTARIGLRIASQSADGTRVQLEPRAEMRAGGNLTFDVDLQALQPGTATFEVQVTSARSPAEVSGRDTVTIVP